jgi:predicted transcriptional regulator
MADENPPQRVDPHQVADIVSSYLGHHQVPADQLTALISEVHRALAGLGTPHWCKSRRGRRCRFDARCSGIMWFASSAGFARRYCGVTCGSHMALPSKIIVVAPAYSDRHSVMAKALRLGRGRGSATPP